MLSFIKRKFRENANIINVFTLNKGKIAGIVYGGNSRKIRNYLQISNKLFVFNNLKNDNKIGYFKTELIKAISPNYFNDKERTSALISLCSLLNSLLPESQPYKNIYKSFEKLINTLNLDNYLKTDIEIKFSEQEVRVILYLPEGTVLYTDRNFSRSWRYSYLSYGNNLLNDMKFGHYYLIKEDTAECLDCVEENEEEEEVVAEKIEVVETINQESTSNEEPELSVKINEEDGIDIQVNDN